ncbi:hypothetical protein SAMN05660649_04150 [Desulfotomaculum arcticum]|uniref:Uncharacterized protein n=1 Tax=Desulfotruncus arcticus DSM 17038 TaxID=1121424 RepID=A0A1I2XX18_9FIRM|nr:hypothetical protein [Desulfotruncus arcticus]SFH17629.1 hypothetical protein SAMN05660649_04150 [Desulfotomaculum arcticum] [Desulfotruncus arcticus DSM 17038]
MNEYKLITVVQTKEYVYIRIFVNETLVNPEGLIKLKHSELDQLFRDLFKGSKGKCIRLKYINT